jgi:selenocysteine-specific elongation factor
MFKKETDITPFLGAAVTTGRGEAGAIEGRFGASGKFRVDFSRCEPPLAPAERRRAGDNALVLSYKKFVYEDRRGGRQKIQQ